MSKINLLPPDLVPKSLTLKITKVITQLIMVGYALFICASVVLISLFVVNLAKLTSLEKTKSSLLNSITNNQRTEQNLFLVKDRLAKIKFIQTQKKSDKVIEDVSLLIKQLPLATNLTNFTLSPTGINLVFTTTDPTSVSRLINKITEAKLFTTIQLDVFNYDEIKGYTLGFKITK